MIDKICAAIPVSIPSPSGLLQNRSLLASQATMCFNPFSFRSPSKPSTARTTVPGTIVSIPSPSGLLQNSTRPHVSTRRSVSIPSPSGLLQNGAQREVEINFQFQSLLLQVSFKTRLEVLKCTTAKFQSLLLQVSFKTQQGG